MPKFKILNIDCRSNYNKITNDRTFHPYIARTQVNLNIQNMGLMYIQVQSSLKHALSYKYTFRFKQKYPFNIMIIYCTYSRLDSMSLIHSYSLN